MGERTVELKQEIDETRERLDETVERLGDRVEQITEQARRRAMVAATMKALREFPRVAASALGVTVVGYAAWQAQRLFASRRSRRSPWRRRSRGAWARLRR